MERADRVTERFEADRAHLGAIAYRMLGSRSDAEDAVQETWLRLSRSDTREVDNLSGWLTTVVSRICLDVLRTRVARREVPAPTHAPDVASNAATPEDAALLADSVGAALLVVLETLRPAERLAFVLHDIFGVPFDEIGRIIDTSPANARQLASRARRRVQQAPAEPAAGQQRKQEVVAAFLAASREGRFHELLALLHPDVVLRADAAAVHSGADELVVGAPDVAGTFSGRARAARLALVDGVPGAIWLVGGQPRVAFTFTVEDGLVVAIDLQADPAHLSRLDVEFLA